MALLSIYKASAGSGKTFRLTGEYLKLIFNPNQNFRSILAVTFTNKATAEMRERILKELHKLASGKKSDHAEMLKKEFNISNEEIKKRAEFLLRQILHNYSRFNISTIDSFFQKILKAFTRETGMGAGYNIELNFETILEQSIGLFFENTRNNPETKHWLSEYALQKIKDGRSWDIERDIYKFSKNAFDEVFFGFSAEQLQQLGDINNFKSYKSQLNNTVLTFIKTLNKNGVEAVNHIKRHGLEVADFSNGLSGVAGYLVKLQNANKYKLTEPGVRVLKAFSPESTAADWYTKTSTKKNEIEQCVNSGLSEILKNTISYYNANIENFNTAQAILKGLDVFAVVVEVFNQMNEHCREKNIFLLAMASPLLSKLIGNDDAPFIYEKTGEYLKYFMIDEFQDTSRIQWDNFSPLFLNGISQQYKSLVVGDVKQAIYRWRNGDWTLLSHKLAGNFANFGVENILLDYNWRSSPNVIKFNNALFEGIGNHAIAYMHDKNAPLELIQNACENIRDIYITGSQKIPDKSKNVQGKVSVKFCDAPSDDEEKHLWYLNTMTQALLELVDQGTQPKDIAILVRKKREGAMVAKHLMEYINEHPERKEQLSFVSNDSVLIGSSSIILLLIAVLEFLSNRKNNESKAQIIYFYSLLTSNAADAALKLIDVDFSDNEQFSMYLPTEFSKNISNLLKLPFPTLIERLLNIFIFPNTQSNIQMQLPFIHTFQDMVLNYAQKSGNDISGFLNWWNEFGATTPINLSDDQNAIRIITIHKSKGLEYSAVIVPFADWSLDQQPKFFWCKAPHNDYHFSSIPVYYSSGLAKTAFKTDYWNERTMALMDNLNLLYVALTRAVNALYIQAPKPAKDGQMSKISDLIFNMLVLSNSFLGIWDEENLCYTCGELNTEMSEKPTLKNKPDLMPLAVVNQRKLNIRQSFNDLYKDEDGVLQKKVNIGVVYHKILERIVVFDDIEPAVNYSVQNGLLAKAEGEKFIETLKNALSLAQVSNWFTGQYRVLNEATLLLKQAETKRPDRVMIGKEHIIVVDYKFTSTANENHQKQVKEYMAQINKIENLPVTGYVWYVLENKVVQV